ncbi:MAG: D-alanine--D-alanine ligase [Nocardioidaceae bacterium]|nr:D-alanine--D-alanine ligase [Nocardioidaceae bacterium]
MSHSVTGRVVVLAGGLSHERDVSLKSGRRVSEALRAAGLEVEESDVDAHLLDALRADPPACVVPLVHGEAGEDGSIREVLEMLDLPYVGSTPGACRLAFDKPVAKQVLASAGISTPRSVALPHEMFRELGASTVIELLVSTIGLPLVVKPARGGSALGVSVVRDVADLPGAMVGCFAYGSVALVEQFVSGHEVAVGVVDTGEGPTALPAVGISPRSGVYDYAARYTAGETEFHTPADLAPEVASDVARVAVTAHESLGLRHLSRSDLIVDADGTVWFLEVNVAPGMTETSSVPLAIEASDWDLAGLCAALVGLAVRPDRA